MQYKHNAVTSLLTAATCAMLALGAANQLQAADASGTWSWSTPGRGGGEPRKTTLKLKQAGEKLTGAVVSPGRQGGEPRETAIEQGKVSGDEISFVVNREFGGNKFSMKYSGKISGDTIKGKIEFDRGGETRSRDWEAKREADKK